VKATVEDSWLDPEEQRSMAVDGDAMTADGHAQ